MIKIVLGGNIEPIKMNCHPCVDLAYLYTHGKQIEYCNPIGDLSGDVRFQNQYVAAMHHAYSLHNAFTLNPDDIWFIIMQGLSNHINSDPEKYRDVMVDFEGKRKILIEDNSLVKGSIDNNWEILFPQFENHISELIKDKALVDLLVPTFSTTTILDRTCFRISLMDICKGYFSYSVRTMCYVPVINIDGLCEDWIKISDNINNILPLFGMHEWLKELVIILDNIISCYNGVIDAKFFNGMYKYIGGSGTSMVSGWVCDLFPYMLHKNNLVKKELQKSHKGIGLDTNKFPPSVSSVPFVWEYYGVNYNMNFHAGFIGYNAQGDSIRARKNYFIAYDKELRQRKKVSERGSTQTDNKSFTI